MLYAIGMDGTGLDGEIMTMAEETGGGHFALPGGGGPDGDVRARCRGTPPAVPDRVQPGSARWQLHRIEVRVGRHGMKVRARRNYLAGRS